jgi:hypothetical protein
MKKDCRTIPPAVSMSPPSPPQPVPPKAPIRAKKLLRWVGLGCGALLGVLILLVVVATVTCGPKTACAASNSTTTSTSTPSPKATRTATHKPTPRPTPTPLGQIVASYKASARQITVSQLSNDPSAYKGTVTFEATIVNFVQNPSGKTVAMNVSDPNDPSSFAMVLLSSSASVPQMNKGDSVTIWGTGDGARQYQNYYGATINEATVTEVYLTDTTTGYQDNTNRHP